MRICISRVGEWAQSSLRTAGVPLPVRWVHGRDRIRGFGGLTWSTSGSYGQEMREVAEFYG